MSDPINDHAPFLSQNPAAPPLFIDLAVPLLRMGFSVIPACRPDHIGSTVNGHVPNCRCGKRPLLREWQRFSATAATEKDIMRWGKLVPHANPAIVFGPATGRFAWDEDGPEGTALLRDMIGADAPDTLWFPTPGGGVRRIYSTPPGFVIPTTSWPTAGRPLTLLGNRSISIAPGGLHPSGRLYAWPVGMEPDASMIVPATPAMLEAMPHLACQKGQPVGGRGAAVLRYRGRWTPADRAVRYVRACEECIAGEGGNWRLFHVLAGLAAAGFATSAEMREAAHVYNREKCKPAWPDAEIDRVLVNATRWVGYSSPVAGDQPGDQVEDLEQHTARQPDLVPAPLIADAPAVVHQVEAQQPAAGLDQQIGGGVSRGMAEVDRRGFNDSHLERQQGQVPKDQDYRDTQAPSRGPDQAAATRPAHGPAALSSPLPSTRPATASSKPALKIAAEAPPEGSREKEPLGRRGSQLVPRQRTFLVPSYFAHRTLHAVSGRMGIGKSHMCTWLMSQAKRTVILPGRETDYETDLPGQARAAGVDPDSFFVVERRGIKLPGSRKKLADLVRDEGAELLLVDPITSYLGKGIAQNDNDGIRAALEALVFVANETGCCVVVIHHPGKRIDNPFKGAGAFEEVPRVLYWLRHKTGRKGPRMLDVYKYNLGPWPDDRYFTIDGGEGGGGVFRLLGVADDQVVEAASESPVEEEVSQIERACIHIPHLLGEGEQTATWLIGQLSAYGIRPRTVYRAIERLGLVPRHEGQGGNYEVLYSMPDDDGEACAQRAKAP